jgi:hypothetical protein
VFHFISLFYFVVVGGTRAFSFSWRPTGILPFHFRTASMPEVNALQEKENALVGRRQNKIGWKIVDGCFSLKRIDRFQ